MPGQLLVTTLLSRDLYLARTVANTLTSAFEKGLFCEVPQQGGRGKVQAYPDGGLGAGLVGQVSRGSSGRCMDYGPSLLSGSRLSSVCQTPVLVPGVT